MDSLHWDAETMLKRYIYDYMVRKNFHASAREFKDEAGVPAEQGAIDDIPYGFLMEWWAIFWDVYAARSAKHGAQRTDNYVSPLNQNNQERSNSEFMEIGSSSREPWPQTQLLQPTMISQKSSSVNFPDNSFRRNYPSRHYQQIKPEYHSSNPFVCLDENWIKQSNFFGSAKQNVQPLRNGRKPSTSASYLNAAMNHAEVKNYQQVKFGQPRLDRSLSFEPNATQQKLSGFLHPAKGIILNEDWSKQRIGASSGVCSNSMNRKLDELLRFTNQHQYSLQGFHAPSLGSYLQAQTVNTSDQIPLFVQMDKHKVSETIDNDFRIRERGKGHLIQGVRRALEIDKLLTHPSFLPVSILLLHGKKNGHPKPCEKAIKKPNYLK